jgi:hypothetical protein
LGGGADDKIATIRAIIGSKPVPVGTSHQSHHRPERVPLRRSQGTGGGKSLSFMLPVIVCLEGHSCYHLGRLIQRFETVVERTALHQWC